MKEPIDVSKMSLNKRIAIFASGKGSLTQVIIDSLDGSRLLIGCIVSDRKDSGVIEIAKANNIRLFIINKS